MCGNTEEGGTRRRSQGGIVAPHNRETWGPIVETSGIDNNIHVDMLWRVRQRWAGENYTPRENSDKGAL